MVNIKLHRKWTWNIKLVFNYELHLRNYSSEMVVYSISIYQGPMKLFSYHATSSYSNFIHTGI